MCVCECGCLLRGTIFAEIDSKAATFQHVLAV